MDVLVDPNGAPGSDRHVRWVPVRSRSTADVRRSPTRRSVRRDVRRRAGRRAAAPLPARLRTIAPLDTDRRRRSRSLELTADRSTGKLVLGINGLPSWDAPPLDGARGRHGDLDDRRTTMDVGPPVPPARLLLSAARSDDGAPLPSPEWKDTFNVPVDRHDPARRQLRRPAGHVDVPLPHPGPRRGRDDGHADAQSIEGPMPPPEPAGPGPPRQRRNSSHRPAPAGDIPGFR